VSIKAGLSTDVLSFVKMPSTAGKKDSLFVAGGGDLFKVDDAGVVTQWGITKPPDGFTAVAGAAGALSGTFKYKVTFRNSVTGHRSNGNPTAVSVTVTNQQVDLASLPISSDPQVGAREIWRTQANGTLFFLLTTINNNTATVHTDNTTDANLSSTELPLDNDPPDDTFNEAIGPHVSRMWWTRDSVVGKKGRLYYSPIGRAESLLAFIDVTTDEDPVQRGVLWNRGLFIFTTSEIIRLIGTTEPFSFIRIDGAPGTTLRRTIVPTPLGIVYQAADGIRLFNGVSSTLIGADAIGGLFRGEAVDGVAAFEGTVAEFANNEFVISDEKTTLALSLADSTWRDVGVPVKAFHYEEDTKKLTAAFNDRHVILEDEGALTDDGTPVPLDVETWGVLSGASVLGVTRRLFIEADTDGEKVTPKIVLDGTEITLPVLTTLKRETVEYAVHRTGRLLSVRLEGSISKRVEVFGVEADVYIPEDTIVEAKT
jgi:hypothetical protein